MSFTFYQCSDSDIESDEDNVALLNEILIDTKYQVPYTYDGFYPFPEDHLRIDEISEDNQASIIEQNKIVNEKYTFKAGDIKYYDTISNKITSSIFIKTEQEHFNKKIIQMSRPYKLNENEVIIFFFETFQYYRDNHPGPVGGGSWAIRFKKEHNKWAQKAYYSGFDLT